MHLPPQETNINENYKESTLLIISDSIMNQLDQKRLTRHGVNVNVRAFSGSTIEDMYFYLIPLFKRKPRYILLHIRTNDAPFKNSNQTTNEILLLNKFTKDSHPEITNKILNQHAYELCQLNVRVLDNKILNQHAYELCQLNVHVLDIKILNQHAYELCQLNVRVLDNKILNQHVYELCQLNVHVLDNSNIHEEHRGKNGLHLNRRGTGRLALNIMSLISQL